MYFKSEKELLKKLKNLKKNFNLRGIKAEFEAEGSSLNDIVFLRKLTNQADVNLHIKIGGVEALNDINSCIELGVDGIIAPMVETKFGAQKFIQSIKKFDLKEKPFLSINIETKDGVNNHKDIISNSKNFINNVTIGRSDLSASYFDKKIIPDSKKILENILQVSKFAKKNNITTTVGGSLNSNTIKYYSTIKNLSSFIKKMETRKVIFNTKVFLNKKDSLKEALHFEERYIIYKKEINDFRLRSDLSRLTALKTRL
jgi:4-hydroxy-2-oxoheptanedioate aldolase|tara:strand:+ start:9075 stop:9845 length:771 start_codon:yes stop_codon:yes gene_type:complete